MPSSAWPTWMPTGSTCRWSRRRRWFFSYSRPAAQGLKIARIFNDLALEICAPAPDRFWPLCQVAAAGPGSACAELDRCLAAGHLGVEIGNHVGDRDSTTPAS